MRTTSLVIGILLIFPLSVRATSFAWLDPERSPSSETIESIAPPPGFQRVVPESETYAAWLQSLPLKPRGALARRFDGSPDRGQEQVYRVIDLDVGPHDLQQCADTVIRLRAEYLYARGALEEIAFDFTSGDRAHFLQWAAGRRPIVSGQDVRWARQAAPDTSYAVLRDYLYSVFTYAGTHSLAGEMQPVSAVSQIRTGDVFMRAGFPGHVVIVASVARHPHTGETQVLLAQGFMPAMDAHLLGNVYCPSLSPWFRVTPAAPLRTPWGKFQASDLMRFPGE